MIEILLAALIGMSPPLQCQWWWPENPTAENLYARVTDGQGSNGPMTIMQDVPLFGMDGVWPDEPIWAAQNYDVNRDHQINLRDFAMWSNCLSYQYAMGGWEGR